MPRLTFAIAAAVLAVLAGTGFAQTATDVKALATMSDAELMKMPAKKVFSAEKLPNKASPRAIGFYAKGCLAGAEELPLEGSAWQVMRPSRNRNWGHPKMISLIERLATEAKQYDGWNGLLVGDVGQPRGGPMPSGHASHQVGLDADIWLTEMPDHELSSIDREKMEPLMMVKDRKTLDRSVWTENRDRLLRRAAAYPEVARIFVTPPIKAELCKWATGDRSWLAKIRPYFGHDHHFHIRIKCPADSPTCKSQPAAAPADGTGCGKELAYWLGDIPWKKPAKPPTTKPVKPAPPLTVAGLPAECRAVATAP